MATGTGTVDPCEFPRIPNLGQRAWSLKRDPDGHRTYKITHRVEVDRGLHGPLAALVLTPGLPEPGSTWDETELTDDWAFFTQEADVVQVAPESNNCFFDITQTATTKPTLDCVTAGREDPLSQPDRVRIEYINYTKEATYDRNGEPILNAAWEMLRGPQVEFDCHRIRVIIEQNVAAFDIPLVSSLMHNLNDAEMWNFDPRYIKLSGAEGEPKYHTSCEKYWLRRLIFDVADDFDRCVLNEGTKVLRGDWDRNPNSNTYGQWVVARANPLNPFSVAPDPLNPRDFIRYKDWNGENTRVILSNNGKPWDATESTTGTDDDTIGEVCIEYYPSGNLLLLGIPIDIESVGA